ncbi:hypothetical protein ACTXKK_08135, partial [Psychrobacter cibarius]|uniref:hypothetical protein n=1 Tax=Psychrobacter cibarius TaxID=282669 RepID=UPI003FD5AFBA
KGVNRFIRGFWVYLRRLLIMYSFQWVRGSFCLIRLNNDSALNSIYRYSLIVIYSIAIKNLL